MIFFQVLSKNEELCSANIKFVSFDWMQTPHFWTMRVLSNELKHISNLTKWLLEITTEHLSSSMYKEWAKNIGFFLSITYYISYSEVIFSLFFSLQKQFCQIFDQRFPLKGGQRPPRIGHKCLQNRQAYLLQYEGTRRILLLLSHPLFLEPDQKIITYLLSCLPHCYF